MADEESNYKVEYLDGAEDAPEEERVFTWIARAGKARVTYNSGAVYEGEFNDEKMKHGQGKYTWMAAAEGEDAAEGAMVESATYEGEYKDGKRDGVGTMTYPNGDVYTGEWKESKMHGVGTYKYKASDDIYSGAYADGLKEGAGTYEFGKCKSKLDGAWAKGTFTEGEWQFKDAGSYVGSFAPDGQPIGPGKYNFVTATGDKITQEGAYTSDEPMPEAPAEGEEAGELPPRTWVGVPVK
jgi:hypothetical protein